MGAQKGEAAAGERRLFDQIADFLDGFKEVRLNAARSNDLFDDAVEVSKTAANIKIRTQAETFKMIVMSQISMYILLGAVVFVAPNLSDTLGGSSIAKATTALLFVVGACFGLVQSIPILLNANSAADRIERLEAAMRGDRYPHRRGRGRAKSFEQIEMRNIVFRYVAISDTVQDRADRFHLAPASWFSSPAATVGKVDVPAGAGWALPPNSGEVLLDGRPITKALAIGIAD